MLKGLLNLHLLLFVVHKSIKTLTLAELRTVKLTHRNQNSQQRISDRVFNSSIHFLENSNPLQMLAELLQFYTEAMSQYSTWKMGCKASVKAISPRERHLLEGLWGFKAITFREKEKASFKWQMMAIIAILSPNLYGPCESESMLNIFISVHQHSFSPGCSSWLLVSAGPSLWDWGATDGGIPVSSPTPASAFIPQENSDLPQHRGVFKLNTV